MLMLYFFKFIPVCNATNERYFGDQNMHTWEEKKSDYGGTGKMGNWGKPTTWDAMCLESAVHDTYASLLYLGGGNLLLGKRFALDGQPDKVFPGFNQSHVSSATTRGSRRLCQHISHRQVLLLQLQGSKDGKRKFWPIKVLGDWCDFSQIKKESCFLTCWAGERNEGLCFCFCCCFIAKIIIKKNVKEKRGF